MRLVNLREHAQCFLRTGSPNPHSVQVQCSNSSVPDRNTLRSGCWDGGELRQQSPDVQTQCGWICRSFGGSDSWRVATTSLCIGHYRARSNTIQRRECVAAIGLALILEERAVVVGCQEAVLMAACLSRSSSLQYMYWIVDRGLDVIDPRSNAFTCICTCTLSYILVIVLVCSIWAHCVENHILSPLIPAPSKR